jgi:hypothetical protein
MDTQNRMPAKTARTFPVNPLAALLHRQFAREIAQGGRHRDLFPKAMLLHFFVAISLSALQNL